MADQFGSVAQAGAYMMNAGLDAMTQRRQMQINQQEQERDRAFRADQAERTRQASSRENELDRAGKRALNTDMSEAEKMLLERKLQAAAVESQKDRDFKSTELANERGLDQQKVDNDSVRANSDKRRVDIEAARFQRDDPANFRADADYTIGAFTELATKMRVNEAAINKAMSQGEPQDSVYMIGLLAQKDALGAYMSRKGGSLFGAKYKLEVDTATGAEKIVSDQVSLNDILSMRTHLGRGAEGFQAQPKATSEDLLKSAYDSMPKSRSSYQTAPPPTQSVMPKTGADPFGFDTESGSSQSTTPRGQVPDGVDEVIDTRAGKRETIQSSLANTNKAMSKAKAKKDLENLKSAGRYQVGGRDSALGKKAAAEKQRRMAELEAILSE
jgi:hypothetical protein